MSLPKPAYDGGKITLSDGRVVDVRRVCDADYITALTKGIEVLVKTGAIKYETIAPRKSRA